MINATTPASSRDFRPDIQGLRAIAVGAVLLYHAGVPFLPGGYAGVDIFFVISGFLITSHLLRSLAKEGRIDFGNFYARRARRILPAAFVVLGLSVIAALIWYPPLLMNEIWRGAVATALYAPNMLFAVDGTNYLAETTPSLFQHYWSLGIEEQFYLLWPLVLLLGWRFIRSKRILFWAIVVLVATSFAAGALLTFRTQPWAFFSLPTRAWELGAGGIVAMLLSSNRTVLRGVWASIAGWGGVAGIGASMLLLSSSTAFPGYWAALPVAATALVILAGATPTQSGPGRMLSTRPMIWIGMISYSLYLVHWPALLIPSVASGLNTPLPLWVTLSIAAACVPVAWLLYRFVESPARDSAWLVAARPRRTLGMALASSVACVIVATGAYAYSSTIPLYTTQEAVAVETSAPPAATDFVPANLAPALREASGDQPEVYADGCHQDSASVDARGCLYGDSAAPRIALFGDSHAAQWFPAVKAFAEQEGYAVEVYTKSACRSLTMAQSRDGVPYTECSIWRDRVIEHLEDEPPTLVLLSNYSAGSVAMTPGEWQVGLERTIDRINAPVAIIADSPDLGATPSICLSANLSDTAPCAVPAAHALHPELRQVERQVAANRDVEVIDVTPYICGENCEPIIGDTLVYRDAHHLTATFVAELAGPVGGQLRDALLKIQ